MIRFDLRSILLTGIATTALALTTGCGVQTMAGPTDTSLAAITGIVHGGPNPIQSAAVTLYATQNNGYGGAALQLAPTTTTDTGGGFTLAPNVACPAGQFAYVTIAAGDTGGNAVNNNSLLIAALGKCSDLYSGTTYTAGQFVWVDELTTVAAAYALGNFTTITGSGASAVVNISAPANNNAATPCIANGTTCLVTQAAGLGHAFANATNLVNTTTGQANSTLPSPANTAAVVPAALINVMGNILQSCINTTGVTGTNTATSNDGSGCGKLFSLTTPPLSGSLVPSNTLQAMINLAKYPHIATTTWSTDCTAAGSGTTTGTTCLFGLATGNGFYSSALTSAPPDWSIAVVIPKLQGAVTTGCTGTCPGLTYPWTVALDISDNVYVTNNDASSQGWENVVGFAYNGVPLWSTPQNSVQKVVKFIATDGLGNVLTANNSSGANQIITIYSGSTGAVLQAITTAVSSPFGIAVDPFNNIWYSSSVASPTVNIQKLTYTGTTGGVPQYTPVAAFTNPPAATQGLYQLALDANLDIWAIGNASSNSAAFFFPNTGTVASPAYDGTLKSAATAGSTSNGYGIAPDSHGNGWEVNATGLYEITATGTGDSTTLAAGSGIPVNVGYPRYASMDGDDVFWTADNNNGSAGSVSAYDTVNAYARGIDKPCRVNTTTLACGTGSSQTTGAALYGPRGLALDSAGDIWVASAASGNLVEIIGSAAPVWPALSLAKSGRPQ
ncbi:MAG: hypothetical protein P4L10_08640 [Acidobacteriaceae bacterium]|nr:hypothetical protein [Acidobacteriaceae bacterium]